MSTKCPSSSRLPALAHHLSTKSVSIASPSFRKIEWSFRITRRYCKDDEDVQNNGILIGQDGQKQLKIEWNSIYTRRYCTDDENAGENRSSFTGNDQPRQQQQEEQIEWTSRITRRYHKHFISDLNEEIYKIENGISVGNCKQLIEWSLRPTTRRYCKDENGSITGNHLQMSERNSRTIRRGKDDNVDRNKRYLGIRARNLHSVSELEEEICKLEVNRSLTGNDREIERSLRTTSSSTDEISNLAGNDQQMDRSSRTMERRNAENRISTKHYQQMERSSIDMRRCSKDYQNVDGSNQYHGLRTTRYTTSIYIDTHKSKKKQKHPWKEWNDFFTMLQQKDYLKAFLPHLASSNNGDYLQFLSSSQVKRALLLFSQMEDDIIRYLTRDHIKVFVSSSCPNTDKKIVNACKRLRFLCDIQEEEACQKCSLKASCLRAFAKSPDSEVQTIDLVRVLYTFALKAIQMKELLNNATSVCKILDEIVHLCNGEKYNQAGMTNSILPAKHHLSCGDNQPCKKTSTQRPSDWTCPDCKFLNFDKTRECRQCGTMKDSRKQHEPEDWECPKCTFVNFRKNKKCLECSTPRPHRSDVADMENIIPGDWRCPECNFVNFQRNEECYRCSIRKPLDLESHVVEELEPGHWKCVDCNFRNFRRNKNCFKCGAVCSVCLWKADAKTMSTEADGWGKGRRKSCNEGKNMGDDDDELELDADVVFD